LVGRTTDWPDEIATLAFSAATSPPELPEALEDATVEQVSGGHFRIWSGQREWIVPARAIHLHREVATVFYRAVAPRAPPWSKRVFWRLLLALLANRTSRRLLRRLKGR
jgi:hypothetical protein